MMRANLVFQNVLRGIVLNLKSKVIMPQNIGQYDILNMSGSHSDALSISSSIEQGLLIWVGTTAARFLVV